MNLRVLLVLLLGISIYSFLANADQFHYSNILKGDRAMGLGGAFCAVSDDASGIVYNPAGLAFALSNDISGSANAFYSKKITYKKTIGPKDFVENSDGNLAPFFGGLQKLDNVYPGLVFAFGLFTDDSDLKDQDDNIVYREQNINRFHRTVTVRASTSGAGIAVAKRFYGNFALGFALSFIMVDELVQEYQDALTGAGTAEDGTQLFQILNQNVREHLKARIIAPTIGVQWALSGGVSLGLSVKVPFIISEDFDRGAELHRTIVDQTLTVSRDENVDEDRRGKVTRAVVDQEKNDEPLGEMPTEIRAGVAWFASPRLLWTFDAIQYTATEGDLAAYKRDAVTNFATGIEYYVTPAFPLRFGLFTNNDARPEPSSGKTDQRDHIDYIGGSLFLAWVQPNSQIAFGTVMQSGTGKAQKIAQVTNTQDVSALSTTFAFAATHSF